MVCQTTKRLTPKHIGEERAGRLTLIALMMQCIVTISVVISVFLAVTLFDLQCVIVVFADHTHLLWLLLVKLYTRQTDSKTWCSCSIQKVTLLELSQSMELMMLFQNSFLTNVSKNVYVYFPDNIDIE